MTDIDIDLASATARQLLTALGDRRISAVDLCEAAIARIERMDGVINTVVVRDFDRARDAARDADAERASGARRPLLGLPVTVKESLNVAGLPTSWGLTEFRDFTAEDDAVTVARLKRAGAVILGKTNIAPALADWQSDNPVYGRTQNPHDPTRTAGGSSGGSAAALAAGFVTLELGSDIGGSIRVPAHFCGVFGHKPSYGLVPTRGHSFPNTDGAAVELAVVGPLARTAGDLALALDVLAGPDIDFARAYKLALPAPKGKELRDFRVLILDEHPRTETDSQIRKALAELTEDLRRAGAKVARESAHLPDLSEAHDLYMKMCITITSRAALPNGHLVSAPEWLALLDQRAQLQRRCTLLFADFDAIIAPTFGSIAFQHIPSDITKGRRLTIDGVETKYHHQFAWPGFASVANLPATVVPIAQSSEGMPIGVQIIGPFLEDRTTIAIAAAVEDLRAKRKHH